MSASSPTADAHAASAPNEARPADALEVRDVVRDAASRRTALRIVGRGTWLDAGRPVAGAAPLDLGALSGIVDYTPGDLTLTARAATPLAELERVTAAEGQMLALDPFGDATGSIGATLATASAGPLAAAFGPPRDQLLGVELVTGSGDIVRGGGRVVKNVAGFDLTRLMVGAWGTLGALTEVTVRLRARPERDETVALVLPDEASGVARVLDAVRTGPLAPVALELLDDALVRRLGIGTGAVLLARLAGNAALVRAQREAIATMAPATEAPSDVWERLRASEPPDVAVFRLSRRPSALAETWRAAVEIARALGGWVHATVPRGVVRCVVPAADASALREVLGSAHFGGTIIHERLPAPLWPLLAPSAVDDRLSRGVRDAFDPHRILNPGILGEQAP